MVAMNMRNVLEYFSGKRVFVTGHTGFKGTWLTFVLKELGADVMGFALPPEPGRSHFELLDLQARISHVVGDIRDASALCRALQSFQPEYVFHLAAQSLVKKSYDDPLATFGTNIMGSVHLLDAVKHSDSVRSLVYITSDKCYDNVEWVWGYRENDRLGGHDPYSASKAAAELVFTAYAKSFFSSRPELGAATARAGNVIGGGDWAADRIVPDCIRAIEMNGPVQLRNPQSTRPWQHVLEPISGYLLLAANLRREPEKYSGSWNFGPSSSEVRTVHEVAGSIIQHLGRGRIEINGAQQNHYEARLLQLNCDKAHQLLGWQPRWHVDKTLAVTAQWYKTILEGGDAEMITRAQVREYFSELS
jgi:CDP-glucose 4,6-dehydratase